MERVARKIALAVCRDGKILMVRTKNQKEVFYNVGGKIDPGETDLECLKRETLEEVGAEVDEGSLKYLGQWEDNSRPGTNWDRINIKLFAGKLLGEPRPSGEIVELRWMDSRVDRKHLTPITVKFIFPFLKKEGYIK